MLVPGRSRRSGRRQPGSELIGSLEVGPPDFAAGYHSHAPAWISVRPVEMRHLGAGACPLPRGLMGLDVDWLLPLRLLVVGLGAAAAVIVTVRGGAGANAPCV